jgi:hypothetical protein
MEIWGKEAVLGCCHELGNLRPDVIIVTRCSCDTVIHSFGRFGEEAQDFRVTQQNIQNN